MILFVVKKNIAKLGVFPVIAPGLDLWVSNSGRLLAAAMVAPCPLLGDGITDYQTIRR